MEMNAHLHDQEIKVRLTKDDAIMIRQIAKRNGLKPAAVARSLILRALSQTFGTVNQNDPAIRRA